MFSGSMLFSVLKLVLEDEKFLFWLLERLVIQPAHINGSYLIINPFMHSGYLPTYVSSTESYRFSCKVYLYVLFNS